MRDGKSVIVDTTSLSAGRHSRSVKIEEQVLQMVRYRAVWRSRHLIIFPIDCHPFRQSVSPVMEGDRERLLACMIRSPVKRVLLSTELPVAELRFWADLGREANLPVYIRLTASLSNKRSMLLKLFSRLFNVVGAATLLFLLSPVMFVLAGVSLTRSGHVFRRSWSIGNHGILFQKLSFENIYVESSLNLQLEDPTFNQRLQLLPGLFNVLLGETSFALLNFDLKLEDDAILATASKV